MVVVSTIFVIAVVVVVVKVMARATPFIDMGVVVEELVTDVRADAVIDTLSGVEIIVAAAVVSALKFTVPISYCVDVLSGMVVDALIEAVAAGLEQVWA